jgi:hypothetical protein
LWRKGAIDTSQIRIAQDCIDANDEATVNEEGRFRIVCQVQNSRKGSELYERFRIVGQVRIMVQ